MRSTLLILAGALTLGGARLHAQTVSPGATLPPAAGTVGRAGHGRHHGMRGELLRGVSLSADQRAQMKTIHARYRDQRRTMRGTTPSTDSASRAAFRSQARTMHEREMADVRTILTPAQQATFDRNVADWRAQQRTRHAGRRAAR